MARYENECESCGHRWSSRSEQFRCSRCQGCSLGLVRIGCIVIALLLAAALVAMLPRMLEPPPAVTRPLPPPPTSPPAPLAPTPQPAPKPQAPPPKPAAKLVVHGRSGAPVNGEFKVVITVENAGDATAEGVSVKVRLVADGVDIETVDAAGPRSIEPNGRAKFRATYGGEHVSLIKDFVPEVKFKQ